MDVSSAACARFGLDPTKLENEQLLKNRCYRRLYNIVATDQAFSSSVFRPHLIKELYFLLQITPFIEDVLQDHFLSNIEEWYNSNDHKKIQLSKNLQGKVEDIFKSSQQKHVSISRPKTGVQWDSTLNPFLRPYTAKMRKNTNGGSSHHFDKSDKQAIQSTNANTYEIQSSYEQKTNIKNVVDIEEQWERSQDFTNKHRTLHPQEEPTFQKLMSIIDRASLIGSENNSYHLSQQKSKGKRKIQSAMVNRQKIKEIAQEQLKQMKKAQCPDEAEEEENQFNEFDERQEENQGQSNPVIEMDDVEFEGTKCFTKDKRTKNGSSQARMYTRVNGVRIVRPLTGKQANIIQKLGTYSNMMKNNYVRKTKEDQQFADHYQEYIRKRTNLKTELSRKTQSIRMLKSAKLQRRNPSSGQLSQKNLSDSNKQNDRQQNLNEGNNGNEAKQFVLYDPFSERQKILADPKKITHYDQNKFFKKSSSTKIRSAFRDLKDALENKEPNNEEVQPCLTANQRLGSQLKFDPLNILSRDQYNEEILDDIEKIKMKFGGKFSVSSQALMKALYVETPVQKMEFQVPNKAYTMLSNGEKKKKKKKGRKLNKSKPKGPK